MAKKFNMLELAKEALGDVNVSKVDTVQQLDTALIDVNSSNFYEMSDLEGLAASIELVGLMHPVIVRPNDERYTLIDGERRFRAMTEVLGWTEIFAIVRRPANDVVEELMLIEANRPQRKMSAADLSKQAERYTELLAQLKEAGVAIPGRLRDRVAEALQVSSTKLARLHAIRENLVPELLDKFDRGVIGESVAYEFSRKPKKVQTSASKYPDSHLAKLTADGVKSFDRAWSGSLEAKKPEPESAKTLEPNATSWDAEAYLQEREEEDLKYFDLLRHVADRFLPLLTVGESRQDGIEDLKETYRYRGFSDSACYADGSGRGLTLTCPGFKVLRTWTEVYDMLCIIALRRAAEALKAKEDPQSESDHKPAGLEWHRVSEDDLPPDDGEVVFWGVKGLRTAVSGSRVSYCQMWPDEYRWWAVVDGPEEET